jgi:hypothetical protein
MSSLRTCHHHAQDNEIAIRSPGTIPARNSFVIETPPTTPNRLAMNFACPPASLPPSFSTVRPHRA